MFEHRMIKFEEHVEIQVQVNGNTFLDSIWDVFRGSRNLICIHNTILCKLLQNYVFAINYCESLNYIDIWAIMIVLKEFYYL